MDIETAIEAGRYEPTVEYSKETRAEYRAQQYKGEQLFKEDLEKEFGLTEYSRRNQVFEKAWSDGHAYGFRPVYENYAELVELIDPGFIKFPAIDSPSI